MLLAALQLLVITIFCLLALTKIAVSSLEHADILLMHVNNVVDGDKRNY